LGVWGLQFKNKILQNVEKYIDYNWEMWGQILVERQVFYCCYLLGLFLNKISEPYCCFTHTCFYVYFSMFTHKNDWGIKLTKTLYLQSNENISTMEIKTMLT
jgi:hypothetical protein